MRLLVKPDLQTPAYGADEGRFEIHNQLAQSLNLS